MKSNHLGLALVMIIVVIFSACNSSDKEPPDVSDIDVSLQITRWDQQLFQLSTKEEVAGFLNEHRLFGEEFLHVDQYPHDSLAVNYLLNFLSNPGSKVLQQEIEEVFGDMSDLQQEFQQAFQYLKNYYPQSQVPRIYTAVTGFSGNDLYVSDSVIIVGLEYYLGDSATYRPLDFPNYILKRYRPEYIVPSSVLLLSTPYNRSPFEDQTMLAEMIYFGKAYYFSQQILPFATDSLLIGYSGQDLTNVYNNQDVIWAHFVEKKLLYETSHFTKKKYMDERPTTVEIGNKCPGRIGEWLGWQIVMKYMKENPQISLDQLMESEDVQGIFTQSRYKPPNR